MTNHFKMCIKRAAALAMALTVAGAASAYAAENPVIDPMQTVTAGISTAVTPVQLPTTPQMPQNGASGPWEDAQKTQNTPAQNTPAQNSQPVQNTQQVQESYLGGAELRLLAPATSGQNMSSVIRTKGGSVIVIDGGGKEDADHLLETVQGMGGRVSAWLITHPHSDHVGALTEILNRNPIPVEIENIYYSFLERDTYERGENMGRMADYDNLMAAFNNIAPERLHSSLGKGQIIPVDDAVIHVLNLPYRSLYNTFNNSSIAYRIDVGGKRILFLGDMGWDAGQNLLSKCDSKELKADVVQMAHHGQDGVEEGVYRVIRPEICLWPTPEWLWDNVKDGQAGAGPWKTLTVRQWMENLGVQRNLCVKDGDQILR